MYENIENKDFSWLDDIDMEKIVQHKGRKLCADDKLLLISMFKELELKQKEHSKHCSDILEKELEWLQNKLPKQWKIKTALLSEDELVANYMEDIAYPMLQVNLFGQEENKINEEYADCDPMYHAKISDNVEENILPAMDGSYKYVGIAFLDCQYDKICDYCLDSGRKYQAKVYCGQESFYVNYHFERWYGFINMRERIMENAAMEHEYHINVPIIFSPWSRRAVAVKLDFAGYEDYLKNECVIDYLLKENGIDNVLLFNKNIYWNVIYEDDLREKECRNQTVISKFVIPHGAGYKYTVYQFDNLSDDEYIYLKSNWNDNYQIKRIGNNIYVGITENENLGDIPWAQISLNQANWAKEVKNYINEIIYGPTPKRIRTLADLHNIVNQFLPSGLKFLESSFDRNWQQGEIVPAYEREAEYRYYNDLVLREARTCYLKFADVSDDNFFIDRVNYLVAFLNNNYPEFDWQGVC